MDYKIINLVLTKYKHIGWHYRWKQFDGWKVMSEVKVMDGKVVYKVWKEYLMKYKSYISYTNT